MIRKQSGFSDIYTRVFCMWSSSRCRMVSFNPLNVPHACLCTCVFAGCTNLSHVVGLQHLMHVSLRSILRETAKLKRDISIRCKIKTTYRVLSNWLQGEDGAHLDCLGQTPLRPFPPVSVYLSNLTCQTRICRFVDPSASDLPRCALQCVRRWSPQIFLCGALS